MTKPTIRMLLVSCNFIASLKEFTSCNAKNLGSVDQRASKLLAVKFGVLKKKSAPSAIPAKLCASVISPGSSSSEVELFSKFEG